MRRKDREMAVYQTGALYHLTGLSAYVDSTVVKCICRLEEFDAETAEL